MTPESNTTLIRACATRRRVMHLRLTGSLHPSDPPSHFDLHLLQPELYAHLPVHRGQGAPPKSTSVCFEAIRGQALDSPESAGLKPSVDAVEPKPSQLPLCAAVQPRESGHRLGGSGRRGVVPAAQQDCHAYDLRKLE
jgi:hypothetical protein